MLVVDASVAFVASAAPEGFALLPGDLVAPPLMWSETRAALRMRSWEGVIDVEEAGRALERLEACPVSRRSPRGLGREAWGVAVELGWKRTYDAEYVGLARLLRCRLVTLDARLRRGTDRLGFVVSPGEL